MQGSELLIAISLVSAHLLAFTAMIASILIARRLGTPPSTIHPSPSPSKQVRDVEAPPRKPEPDLEPMDLPGGIDPSLQGVLAAAVHRARGFNEYEYYEPDPFINDEAEQEEH